MIGSIPLGGENPIRIQSMTTTNTLDTKATVEQSIRMIDAGCEYVRVTAPSKKEAYNLLNIKNMLLDHGYNNPLIADIHFTPNAAEIAARIVEKVRINPGNFADRKKFQYTEYSDLEYQNEIDRISQRFTPLIKICKEYGTAMRIGTNHGSLSDRILSRYGDTPLGMVESAMEFIRICEDNNYYNLILSMKSSNPIVMVQAYRLLINKMDSEGMNYPLHLGVTEAGDGQDGRVKSALGIGALLDDGLGDTIRVSLTEDPENEMPVAKRLINYYKNRIKHSPIKSNIEGNINPFEYLKMETRPIVNFGGNNVPRVINNLESVKDISVESLSQVGYFYSKKDDKWEMSDLACDYIFIGDSKISFEVPGSLGIIQNYQNWQEGKQYYPAICKERYLSKSELHPSLNFLYANLNDLDDNFINKIKNDEKIVLLIHSANSHPRAELRQIFFKLIEKQCTLPIIICREYNDIQSKNLQLYASIDIGGLLLDGLGDGVYINSNRVSLEKINSNSFSILQATRTRISKTEYISCPSCGRTLFDLQETTARIRLKTEHLKGVKIGIMGCIVNGPGEMADADYGYVGTGLGKITLYRGQNPVEKNIPTRQADNALIELIKKDGRWIEPSK